MRASTELERFAVTPDGLELKWSGDSRTHRLPWLWLRDHCRARESFRADTHQRMVETASIPPDIRGTGARLADDGAALSVTWDKDETLSRFDLPFLAEACRHPRTMDEPAFPRTTWQRNRVPEPVHDFGNIMSEVTDLKAFLDDVVRWGFGLVEAMPGDSAATRALAERIGYIRMTVFGDLWEFSADLKHGDTAYTNLAIGPHTDGTYSHDAPGLQLLHCLAFEGEGGHSVLVDGFRIAERLEAEDPRARRTLEQVPVPGQYIEDGVHLRAERPILRRGVLGDLEQVSYNNHDRAPFRLPDDEMAEFYRSLSAFGRLANDPVMQWRRRLLPGMALLVDNWRLLHARDAFTGHRHMAGAYINREDFESRLRVLAESGS